MKIQLVSEEIQEDKESNNQKQDAVFLKVLRGRKKKKEKEFLERDKHNV